MKELIIIGAYCPDKERLKLLHDCIKSLSPVKDDFDIMISTHTPIPEYVADMVDYVFYDKKNKIIYDIELLNKPWFSPTEDLTVVSTFVTGLSTFIAAYRIFIGALGIARNFKYNKVHWVEYDSFFTNYDDFYDNSKLLDYYTAVQYKKESKNFEKNIDWGYGCFQSINIKKLDETFLIYDEDDLLEILRNSPNKTNEQTTEEIYKKNGGEIFFKDFNEIVSKNTFNLSENTSKENLSYWSVPFYNTKEDIMSLIVWNNISDDPINVTFIVNDEKLYHFSNIEKFCWSIQDIGDINEVKKITTIVNDKIKNNILFDDKFREIFKRTNYAYYS